MPLAALLLALALTSCAPGPTPPPSPNVTEAAATPIPSTPEPVLEPSEIVVGPDGFVVAHADESAPFVFAWADDPAPALAELEELFGAAPEVTIAPPGEGSPHYAPSDSYSWDSFTIFVAQLDRPRDEYLMPSFVRLTGDESHGVRLTSRLGISVGDDIAAVLLLNPAPEVLSFPSDEGQITYYYADFSTDPAVSRAVLFGPAPDGSVVERIFAPRSPQDP